MAVTPTVQISLGLVEAEHRVSPFLGFMYILSNPAQKIIDDNSGIGELNFADVTPGITNFCPET